MRDAKFSLCIYTSGFTALQLLGCEVAGLLLLSYSKSSLDKLIGILL